MILGVHLVYLFVKSARSHFRPKETWNATKFTILEITSFSVVSVEKDSQWNTDMKNTWWSYTRDADFIVIFVEEVLQEKTN